MVRGAQGISPRRWCRTPRPKRRRYSSRVLGFIVSPMSMVPVLLDGTRYMVSGVVWFWFIDVFAVACVIFAVTGLALLWLHARGRPSTWPIVGLGLLIPVVIALLFIH